MHLLDTTFRQALKPVQGANNENSSISCRPACAGKPDFGDLQLGQP